MSSGMKVVGADKFISGQHRLMAAVPKQVEALIRSTSASTQQQAQRLEPVKTGFLKRQTKVTVTNNAWHIRGVVSADAYNGKFNYGYAQENGTKHIKPKLFMYQAFETHKNVFISKIKAVVHV
ncbi:hypothetical protein FFRU_180100 [Fructobacillus fructosus]|uniref:hypothetical protein n=1 Tax=Fructobacillus fructosus TaxID=1631 RepID=UPI0002195C9C|nr:hypothetical protein [Fructobacillus fructosus]KRN51690.1 hypothetical protein IV71_GL000525 [Fructobacillus fructosus KCTC 3544]GAP01953.1 hypothetical protein FFRU_180100 [Fructobacillus fructosus]